MILSVDLIQDALNDFSDSMSSPKEESIAIIEEATAKGYVVRFSHTQAGWTDETFAKAEKELVNENTELIDLSPSDSELVAFYKEEDVFDFKTPHTDTIELSKRMDRLKERQLLRKATRKV